MYRLFRGHSFLGGSKGELKKTRANSQGLLDCGKHGQVHVEAQK